MEHKQEPEFRWFGEGFDGFPRRLPEDIVEYQVFIITPSLKGAALRQRFTEVLSGVDALHEEFLKDYIWQKDSFKLETKTENGRDFLSGRTSYGDSVEDEWLIVFLLQELSRRFPDTWIKVQDSDGDFLLVEAANVLPKWMSPEIAENRVWIHNGQLNLIPLHQSRQEKSKAGSASKSLALDEALKFIQNSTSLLLQSPTIEGEAFYRIRNYPKQIRDNMHHAEITIPRKLFYILRTTPTSISPAIDAFYLRDPIAMNALKPRSKPLVFLPADLVSVVVKFPKVGYAQIKSQHFSPPSAWASALSRPDSQDHAKIETGMKVTCGFEMLLGDPQNEENKQVKVIKEHLNELDSGKEKLPTDKDIASLGLEADDESWININFDEFEKELAGKASKAKPGFPLQGFGAQTTQEEVQKMVERFESFLNDDKAGFEGAQLSDESSSDEDSDESDETDEGEDKAASFDDEEFENMMRQMMGLPPEPAASSSAKPGGKVVEVDSEAESEDLDNAALQSMMNRIEKELKETGALDRRPGDVKGKGKENANASAELDDDDVAWIEAALSKNMRENFSLGGDDGPELSSDEEIL